MPSTPDSAAATAVPVRLASGDAAPAFELRDQKAEVVSLASLAGAPVLLYFYPKALTPGCTTQSCLLRDIVPDAAPGRIVGISPDEPGKLDRFDEKYGLGFTLLSDPDHRVAEAYGAWGEKKLYGKVYDGIIRSAFLIDGGGAIAAAFYKISPKDTPVKLLACLADLLP